MDKHEIQTMLSAWMEYYKRSSYHTLLWVSVVCISPSPLFIMSWTTIRYDSSLHNLSEFKVRSYIVYFGVLPSAIITHIPTQAFVFIIQLNETSQKVKEGY